MESQLDYKSLLFYNVSIMLSPRSVDSTFPLAFPAQLSQFILRVKI